MQKIASVTSESISTPELRTGMLIAEDITFGGVPLLGGIQRPMRFEQTIHDAAEDAHEGRKAGVASDCTSEFAKLKVAMGEDVAALQLKLVAQEADIAALHLELVAQEAENQAREKIMEHRLEKLERNMGIRGT